MGFSILRGQAQTHLVAYEHVMNQMEAFLETFLGRNLRTELGE